MFHLLKLNFSNFSARDGREKVDKSSGDYLKRGTAAGNVASVTSHGKPGNPAKTMGKSSENHGEYIGPSPKYRVNGLV
jgi:hypothetical protein